MQESIYCTWYAHKTSLVGSEASELDASLFLINLWWLVAVVVRCFIEATLKHS